MFIGRTDAEAAASVLWPPDAKNWLIGKDPDAGKDWGQEEKGTTEDERVGWHHRLNGHEFEWTLSWWWTGRPGMLQFMGSQSQTRLSDWTELFGSQYPGGGAEVTLKSKLTGVIRNVTRLRCITENKVWRRIAWVSQVFILPGLWAHRSWPVHLELSLCGQAGLWSLWLSPRGFLLLSIKRGFECFQTYSSSAYKRHKIIM